MINIILPKVLYFHMSIFRPEGLERDYELPKLVHLITTTEPYQFERIPINTILHITHTEKVVQKKKEKGKILKQSPWPILLCPTCLCFGIILLIDSLLMVHCAEAAHVDHPLLFYLS